MTLRLLTTGTSQRGVSLIFALITLAAMSLAAVALLRAVDTGALVAGNIAFRQDSVSYSSRSAETAIDWLSVNVISPDKLNVKDGANGYHAIAYVNLDPTDGQKTNASRAVVDWDGNGCAGYANAYGSCLDASDIVTNADLNHRSNFIITRLCATEGAPTAAGNSCARGLSSSLSEGGEKGEFNYNRQRSTTATEAGPYYRIVVRTLSPRNTVSYTETIVHF